MPILPIDLQAILLRMDEVSKFQQRQQEGVIAAQMAKGEELSKLAQIESSRVNQAKPHPDGNTKIEEKEKERKRGLKEQKKREINRKRKKKKEFDDPFRGTIIDTIR